MEAVNGSTVILTSASVEDTRRLGEKLGGLLKGGEVIELKSDIGGGKTSFTKGIAAGLGCTETVTSPTFIISARYSGHHGLSLHHYDFYRLSDPGLMREQLAESLDDPKAITVVEWADTVEDVLPSTAMRIEITASAEEDSGRSLVIFGPRELVGQLTKEAK